MINKTHRWIISVCGVCLLVLMMNVQFQASEDTAQIDRKIGRYRLLRLHYNNSDDEKGVTTFEYDQEGLMYKALWQLLDGSRNSINFYTYDNNGKLTKKYREFSDEKTSTQLFRYEKNGNLVFEDFNRSDGIKGETSYFYDTRGKLLKADCRGLNGWFYGIIKYKYEKQGRKTKADIEREGQKIGTIEYNYDENNNLSEEYWDLSGQWNQTFSYEYEECFDNKSNPYTSSNIFLIFSASNKVTKEDYDYNKKSGGPSFYEYDESGKLTRKTFERSDGLKTETDYFYNADNELIKSLRRYADGGSGIFSYEYNENRNLTRRTFKHVEGSTAEEIYQYDSTGRLIKAVWDKFDTWLTGTITFEYDRSGNPLIGHFKGIGDNKFDADITLSFDKNKNLIRIHWEFSFEGTQTYTFGYEKRAKSDYFPQLKGEYLGRKLPGNIPEIFEGQITSEVRMTGIPLFSKKGDLLIFKGSNSAGDGLFLMDQNNGVWSRPQVLFFLSQYEDRHFFLSHEKTKLFFTSSRPLPPDGQVTEDPNIWVIDDIFSNTSLPQPLSSRINTEKAEFYSTLTPNNILYFTRSSGEGDCDIFRAEYKKGLFTEAESLSRQINTQYYDADPYISPDESYMIFISDKPGGLGQYDFYISFMMGDGQWSHSISLGEDINSIGNDVCPLVTPDGRFFFFGSNRSGKFKTYWMDAKIIEELKLDKFY